MKLLRSLLASCGLAMLAQGCMDSTSYEEPGLYAAPQAAHEAEANPTESVMIRPDAVTHTYQDLLQTGSFTVTGSSLDGTLRYIGTVHPSTLTREELVGAVGRVDGEIRDRDDEPITLYGSFQEGEAAERINIDGTTLDLARYVNMRLTAMTVGGTYVRFVNLTSKTD